MSRSRRALAIVAMVAGVVVLVSSTAESAPTISAPVKARFVKTKKRADTGKINTLFTGTPTKPLLRTKNGKSVPLEAVGSITLTGGAAPPELGKYQSYTSVVSENPLTEQTVAVAIRVDHSSRQTPVKDQKSRGTCGAFGVIAGMESYLRWKANVDADISEEHFYKLLKDSVNKDCNSDGTNAQGMQTYVTGKKICSETLLPYAAPSTCVIPPACTSGAAFTLERSIVIPGDPATPSSTYHAGNTRIIEAFLDMGYDVSIGLDVAGSGWSEDADNGVIDVQVEADGKPADPRGSHFMLAIGYDRPGGYFTVKNSWGADWGRAGYARISYDYVQTYPRGSLVVLEASRKLVLQATTPPQAGPAKPNPTIGTAR